MKRVILSAAVMAISTASFAQSIGAQIGGNLASQSYTTTAPSATLPSAGSKFGFLAGVVAEFPLSKVLSIRPELNYIQKGSKLSVPSLVESSNALNYLELPVNVTYNFEAGEGKFFVGAGPNIALGLSGKIKSKVTGEDEKSQNVSFDGKKEADLDDTDEKAHLKGMDFGFNLLAGYTFGNGLTANVGYTLGFSNLSPEDATTIKNRGLTLKVGYYFMNGTKKK